MQCSEFELIQSDGPGAISAAAQQHATECASCRALVADLDLIRGVARTLAIAPEEAPARVWSNVRARLRAEGIIRDRAERGGWSAVLAWLRRPYVVGAYAAIGLFAIGLIWQPASREIGVPTTTAARPNLISAKQNLDAMETAFASNAANSASAVDVVLRKNLRVVDNFIAVCEKAVKQEPQNEAAREYLYGAYQQKAELLNTAMEHSLTGED